MQNGKHLKTVENNNTKEYEDVQVTLDQNYEAANVYLRNFEWSHNPDDIELN